MQLNIKMTYEDYPAFFKAADKASNRTQKYYLNSVLSYSITLIIGVGLGVYGINSKISAIFAAILFLIGIFISILIQFKQYENIWYKCRAIAESIKTISWRYMMQAQPFEKKEEDEIADKEFLNLIKGILSEHRNLSEELTSNYGTSEQITATMKLIRKQSLNERIELYRTNRIDEQRIWYAKKVSHNMKKSKLWFCILISLHAIAITLVLFRIAYPKWSYWPSEIFVVAGSGVLTWIQVKRFKELATAYGLTAHEISTIRGELETIKKEFDFSQFVINAENAFSREHTQWISKKID